MGENMIAYCNNNPTNVIDPTGTCPHDGKFYMSGPFTGQFEYNPTCMLCAAHGEFYLINSSGTPINMMLSTDQKVLIATIAAEATVTGEGNQVSSQGRQAMANVALNRVGTREWSRFHTVSEICQYTGFDGFGTSNYWECMDYLNNRDGNHSTYEAIVWDVLAAYHYDITDGCQMYFTPAAMYPVNSTPNWNFGLLEEVQIPGVDTYWEGRFFRYR